MFAQGTLAGEHGHVNRARGVEQVVDTSVEAVDPADLPVVRPARNGRRRRVTRGGMEEQMDLAAADATVPLRTTLQQIRISRDLGHPASA
jgi:hypothetical protein